jgi:hypothetical protein
MAKYSSSNDSIYKLFLAYSGVTLRVASLVLAAIVPSLLKMVTYSTGKVSFVPRLLQQATCDLSRFPELELSNPPLPLNIAMLQVF